MSNRRKLKKAIHALTSDLLLECMAVANHNPNAKYDDVENIMESILLMQDEFIRRVSHADKQQATKHFNQLQDDLTVSANQIIDNIFQL